MASRVSGKSAEVRAFPTEETDSLRLEVERLRAELASESALRRTYEVQLKQISASLPVVIWMTDTAHRIGFVSDNWYDFSGTSPEAIRNWSDSIHPEDRLPAIAEFKVAADKRERVAVEYRVVKADGTIAWVLALAAPRFNDEGRYDGYVGALIDISERRAAIDALRHTEARLTLALEGTSVGVWDWNIVTDDVWLSDGALAIQGFQNGEITGNANRIGDIVHPEDSQILADLMVACLKGDQSLVNIEHRLIRKGGGWVWVSERARVVERDKDGRALRMIGTRTDITEQRKRDERIRWLAAHDVLTELPNRARFQEMLLAAMHEADATGGKMALLMLDLDRFKTVNDSFGHDAGDALLRRVARVLKAAFPAPASIARLGGDEFAIILPGVCSKDDVMALAERAVLADTRDLDSSASVGAAFYPCQAGTVTALVKCADVALYRAKERGRACAVFYDPDL